jgi:hypothetical protein
MRGENGARFQLNAEFFLKALINGPDLIVVLKPSKWTWKIYELWKISDVRVQLLSKLFYFGLILDPQKCVFVDADQAAPLPEDLANEVPADDAYLFQAALAGAAHTIVTSDQRLIAKVQSADRHHLDLRPRDEFTDEYLRRQARRT